MLAFVVRPAALCSKTEYFNKYETSILKKIRLFWVL